MAPMTMAAPSAECGYPATCEVGLSMARSQQRRPSSVATCAKQQQQWSDLQMPFLPPIVRTTSAASGGRHRGFSRPSGLGKKLQYADFLGEERLGSRSSSASSSVSSLSLPRQRRAEDVPRADDVGRSTSSSVKVEAGKRCQWQLRVGDGGVWQDVDAPGNDKLEAAYVFGLPRCRLCVGNASYNFDLRRTEQAVQRLRNQLPGSSTWY
eukprot:TRINITY_DN26529_c0_g1_i2.p1 TRINITY_DN26529_c0_g1~~TRINITY_DN26529_c0_g1_i2.p1  ORF type:complete len:225 (+),score=37.80 TRINITY_DN26529_c0_g1_i2:51-677(+)